MVYQRNFFPQQLIHPGSSLLDILESEGMSQKDLSIRTGITEKHITGIVKQKVNITPDMALKLEYALGIEAEFWNNLQMAYDEDKSRLKKLETVKNEYGLLKKYTAYKNLVKLGFVESTLKLDERLDNLLRFFQLTSLSNVPKIHPLEFSFRKANCALSEENLRCWIRAGELKIKNIEKDFDKFLLQNEIIPKLKEMTQSSKVDLAQIESLLGKAGMYFVFIEKFDKVPVGGLTRRVDGKPLIQLSDKGKRADTFWFNLFHEIGHVIYDLKTKDQIFINFEEIVDENEKRANKYASETLVNNEIYEQYYPNFNIATLEEVAQKSGVGLNIVAGRFANDVNKQYKASKIRSLVNPLRTPLLFVK